MQSIKDFFSGFNSLLSQSRALKALFYSFMSCFAISVLILLLIAPLFDCNIFAPKPCSQSFPSNPQQCSAFNTDYCCGAQGKSFCLAYPNCQAKPTFFNTTRCLDFLSVIWLTEVVGIILSIPFFILILKLKIKNSPRRNNYIGLDTIAIIGPEGQSHPKLQHYDNILITQNASPNDKFN